MIKNTAVALLLEDEPLIAMDLEQTLEAAGFVVATVMSCVQAIAWLKVSRPDIVVVDILLRDGSSERVVAKLHDDGIPFIEHSGDHPSQYAGTAFAEGAWLSKPAEPSELSAAARALLLIPALA